MMPYIQGDPNSVPTEYGSYNEIIASTFIEKGQIGYLTIDESPVLKNSAHRAKRAKFGRALHTEAGWRPYSGIYCWGGGGWGHSPAVTLEPDTKILLANNLAGSCAWWDTTHFDTSEDGDIGDCADMYPYETATMMEAGEVSQIGILTPHESVPVQETFNRQFLRIVGNGVHGRETYFTQNPLM